MSAGRADTRATLPETAAGSDGSAVSPALALTILFHPRLDRIGERALLGPFPAPPISEPWIARVSRTEPQFSPVRGGAGQPLEEDHLSRKPVILSLRTNGSVDLDATDTPTKVIIEKHPFDRRQLKIGDLRRGVVLLLSGHVVLLLHAVIPSSQPFDGEPHGLVGQSDGLRAVLSDIRAVADLKKPVLLRGQSGTGKELVARAIHHAGRRSKGPFVAVNLGAVPATIAAAELFGSEKGAFTGAVRRAGYFEQAQGGTLFLDEIGEAAAELQATLLRAIQDSEIQPIGADRPRKVDVRVVAATDADLEAKVKDGSFRAPLLNRLAAYQIWIPSLADRRDDIGRLLAYFFEKELEELSDPERPERSTKWLPDPRWLPAGLIAELCEHDWPGNIRQLHNVVHHLVVHGRGQPRVTMTPAALRLLGGDPSDDRMSDADPPSSPERGPAPEKAARSEGAPQRPPSDLSEEEIRAALRACRWEIDATARHLGVARASLYRALERFPGIRTARDLSVDEVRAAHRALGGDVARMADALEVSEKALLRRVRDLGLSLVD